jgi:hypothetical protein
MNSQCVDKPILNASLTTKCESFYNPPHPRSLRCRLRRRSQRRSEAGVPAARARNAASGGAEPERRALRPGREELAAQARRKCRDLEARTRARKSPGGAPQGARPGVIGTREASQASPPIGNDGLTGCRCTRAPYGAPPAPHRGERKRTNPRRENAPRERRDVTTLFDIVHRKRRSPGCGSTAAQTPGGSPERAICRTNQTQLGKTNQTQSPTPRRAHCERSVVRIRRA